MPMILLRYWREAAICLLVAAAILIALDIKRTYIKVGEQAAKIEQIQQEVKNAKDAIKLQSETQAEWGRIDKRTFANISTILSRPVPRVLVPHGVLQTVR